MIRKSLIVTVKNGILRGSPELYQAYIAMAQITNPFESEKMAYLFMLEHYRSVGNGKMVENFEEFPILTSNKAYQQYFTSSLRDTAMHDLGIGTMRNMKSVMSGIFFPSLRCKVYTPIERINIWRGKSFAEACPVVNDCAEFNVFIETPQINIPVYIFAGKYDYTCNYSLQMKFYRQIQAPLKGFYSFSNSAHSPLFEEPERALTILRHDIINGTNELIDQN